MITPQEARDSIGRKVAYHPHMGEVEEGVITSVGNSGWVFVRYGSDTQSKATAPGQLEFIGPDPGWTIVDVEIVDEVDRKFEFEADEHEQVWMDRP